MAAIISCVSTMVTFSLLFVILIPSASCWDNDDLELFDLVEEINQNFYELFGIEQTATTAEVRKAYRRLSLRLHPDKNDAEDAEEKFRQLVAVYETLKDETKRGKYNQVLIDGLPDWRQPVYYYRRARKMGLTELAILLFIISIIGQYCVGWAVYIEKRLVVEDMMSSKRKKKGKKGKSGGEEEEETFTIPTPTLLGLWPFRFSVFFVKAVYNLPTTVKEWKEEKQWRKEEEERQTILEEKLKQEQLQFEEELQLQQLLRKAKKRVQPELPEYTSEMYAKFSATADGQKSDLDQGLVSELERAALAQERIGEEWTDEELVLLAKAVKKFPGGTMERWERIAEMVGRTVTDVTNKSKESKGGFAIKPNTSSVQGSANVKSIVKISDAIMTQSTEPAVEEEDDDGLMDDNVKVRKRKGHAKNNGKAADKTLISKDKEKNVTIVVPVQSKSSKSAESSSTNSSNATAPVSEGTKLAPDGWTQNQQTIFEWALKQHPKGSDKRWDLISEHIPGKSKDDCITRFKELAELISKKKKVDLLSKSKSS